MNDESASKRMVEDPSLIPFLRSLGAELLVYTPLLIIYLLLVIRFITQPLVRIFNDSPILYSMVSILVIVGQGVLLEMLTSWLLRRFGVRL